MAENDLLNEFEDFGITIESNVLKKCKCYLNYLIYRHKLSKLCDSCLNPCYTVASTESWYATVAML